MPRRGGGCSELAFAQLHCERRTAHRVHGRPHVDEYRFRFWELQKVNPHLRSELFPPADLTQPDLFGCGVGELFGRPTTRNGISELNLFNKHIVQEEEEEEFGFERSKRKASRTPLLLLVV